MNFFLEDSTSTSLCQTGHRNGHEDSQMTDDADRDLLRWRSSSGSMTELQEQRSSLRVDVISRAMQELVEKINNSRASNEKVMDSFQKKLVEKVTEKCELMKKHMYTVYADNSNEMEVKLQELSKVLESCTKLSNELLEANHALASLREGLAIGQSSDSQ